jgi:hypothetical protein
MMRQKLERIATDRPAIPKLKKPKAQSAKLVHELADARARGADTSFSILLFRPSSPIIVDLRAIMQNEVQKGFMNFNFAVVTNQT